MGRLASKLWAVRICTAHRSQRECCTHARTHARKKDTGTVKVDGNGALKSRTKAPNGWIRSQTDDGGGRIGVVVDDGQVLTRCPRSRQRTVLIGGSVRTRVEGS